MATTGRGYWNCCFSNRPYLTNKGFAEIRTHKKWDIIRIECTAGSLYQPELKNLRPGDIVSGPKFGYSFQQQRDKNVHNLFMFTKQASIIEIENNAENYNKMRKDIKINAKSIFYVRDILQNPSLV